MSNNNKQVTSKDVPLSWYVPDNIITRYAANVTVQLLENEFRISFFEVKPEINPSQTLSDIKEVKATCVADIFMSPAKIDGFIKALQRQLDLYERREQNNKEK